MMDETGVFDQPVKNDLRTNDDFLKIKAGQGDDQTTGYLLDYLYFKKHYKMMVID